ncbi:MAG: succinyl-diaminopimelate desuccinylase [Actinomycetota bacterium]|nr:succinyl-diaminopimelate desuccinylase [Actinomycetota bacterium]
MADLLAETAELMGIPSLSHHEQDLADHVEARLRAAPWLEVTRIGANVIARTTGNRPGRIVLAGHLDTVPANGNATPRVEGDTLWGLGAADMKSGLAVNLHLATTIEAPATEVTYVFYAAEEVDREHNGLLAVAASRPDLLAGDVAILGEPTNAVIEAGCQGVVKLRVTLAGRRAHTARPWMGTNAVHRLAPLLTRVGEWEERRPVIDGCQYRESVQVVGVEGGVAGNVVPDRASIVLSFRYAPDRTPDEATGAVRDLVEASVDPAQGDQVEVIDLAPAAPPGLAHPILAGLVSATQAPPRAKLGWTDVAFFTERGTPAVNLGPGDPEVAHSAHERVDRRDLDAVCGCLRHLLATPQP